jgi:hypothetical protein
MKKLALILSLLMFAATSFAQNKHSHNDDNVVNWRNIVGVITALNVDNPVNNGDPTDPNAIHSGTFPWSVRRGSASVDLDNGSTYFSVEGLSINGAQFSGTPGPISSVVGTLVCNPGQRNQAAIDTDVVSLSAQGKARFAGQLVGIPSQCTNPLFLVRIAVPTGARGLWIATATERSFGDEDRDDRNDR